MMVVLTGLFVLVYLMQFLVALINLLFSEKMNSKRDQSSTMVSILIPARNEEKNIQNSIDKVLSQSHSNFELIVCDDQSDDRTAEIVEAYCRKDKRIRLIRKNNLPQDWLGKNHACHTLSLQAKGDFFLFLDADVSISGDIIQRSVNYMKAQQLNLISIFPKQIMLSLSEKLTVPIMNYILLSLLPLPLVRISGFSSLAAANGQFMLFDAGAYKKIEPHKKVKTNKVEDIAIAQYYKKSGLKVSCQTSDQQVSCRMYSNYREAVQGFAKSIAAYFGNSFLLAFVFWIISTFGIILFFIVLAPKIALLMLIIFLLTRILISIKSDQSIWNNILYLIPQQFSMGWVITTALLNLLKKQHQWKGRNII